jgi:hypothetical protein
MKTMEFKHDFVKIYGITNCVDFVVSKVYSLIASQLENTTSKIHVNGAKLAYHLKNPCEFLKLTTLMVCVKSN